MQNLVDLCKTVRELKETAEICLKIQPIPFEKLAWAVITDASYANAESGSSQGGYGVLRIHEDVIRHGEGCGNLLRWKGKTRRVANSTMAAEAQSLAKGLSELAWSVTVFNELVDEEFTLQSWAERVRRHKLINVHRADGDDDLRRCLCVVDAKSLFDRLVKDTTGLAEDKRTAMDVQVIRQRMDECGAEIKWVPHPQLVVDCLTKRRGNRPPLQQLLKSGTLRLTEVRSA